MGSAERNPLKPLVACLVVLAFSADSVGSANFAFAPPVPIAAFRGLPPSPAPARFGDPEELELWKQSRLGGVPSGSGLKGYFRIVTLPDGRQATIRREYENLPDGGVRDLRTVTILYSDGRQRTLRRDFGNAEPVRRDWRSESRRFARAWNLAQSTSTRYEQLGQGKTRNITTSIYPDGRRVVTQSDMDTSRGWRNRTTITTTFPDGTRSVVAREMGSGPMRTITTTEKPDGTRETEESEDRPGPGLNQRSRITVTYPDGGAKTMIREQTIEALHHSNRVTTIYADGRKKTEKSEQWFFARGGDRQVSVLTLPSGWERTSTSLWDPSNAAGSFTSSVSSSDGRRESQRVSREGNRTKIVTEYPDGSAESQEMEFDASRPMGQRHITTFTDIDGRRRVVMSSPLVFDLGARGIKTTASRELFDIRGDGHPTFISGLETGVGVLVFDPYREGCSGADGRGLFGDRTDIDGDGKPEGFADGFEALEALVVRAVSRGVLSRRVLVQGRLDADDLALLESAFGLRMKVGGLSRPAVSLKAAGVAVLFLPGRGATRTRNFDRKGNDLSRRQGAVFVRPDGTRGEYADLWFRHQEFSLAAVPSR